MKKLFICTGALIIGFSEMAMAKPEASHNIEQFESFLSGKVLVTKTPLWEVSEIARRTSHATYLAPDGTDFQCTYGDTKNDKTLKYRTYQGHSEWDTWRLTKPFFSSGVLLTTNGNGTRSIPIYDEKINVLERWYQRKGEWKRLVVGHLQDSWPAWALEKCPDLKLPAGLKINHEQKTPNYEQNYKTYDLTPSGKKITPLTAEEAAAFLHQNNGNILVDSDGKNYVPNMNGREFWKIDEKLEIADIAHLSATDETLDMQWEKGGIQQSYNIGDQIQLKPTGGRHNAFTFTDWLQKQGYVELSFGENKVATLEFTSPNNVIAWAAGETFQGTWKHQATELNLSLSYDTNAVNYYSIAWKDAAKQLEWPGLK
ncbi:hypothetical protein [Kiloniella sp.]|uniref:hypothetical protein n=1 Tax=Kiloniella sp. TaxID=1938587 RepID=UPI003B012BB1